MHVPSQVDHPNAQRADHAVDTSITTRLRFETRLEHEAIETNARLKRLMANDLRMPEYVAVLVRLATFYEPVEHGLGHWAIHFPNALDLAPRLNKTGLLRRDIATLAPGLEMAGEQACSPFGDFASIEEAWGCLYVVEGSTLGGQLIARNLKAAIGATADHGAAFHNPYGTMTGARWQTFKATLNEEVALGRLDTHGIISGACMAFQAMNTWLAADQ